MHVDQCTHQKKHFCFSRVFNECTWSGFKRIESAARRLRIKLVRGRSVIHTITLRPPPHLTGLNKAHCVSLRDNVWQRESFSLVKSNLHIQDWHNSFRLHVHCMKAACSVRRERVTESGSTSQVRQQEPMQKYFWFILTFACKPLTRKSHENKCRPINLQCFAGCFIES